MQEFIIDCENFANLRLDIYLIKLFPQLSRSKIQRLINDKQVELTRSNEKLENLRSSEFVILGDRVKIFFEVDEILTKKEIEKEDIKLDILYEDKDILVINKGVGMPVHPDNNYFSGTLVNALLFHDEKRFKKLIVADEKFVRPGIVHRLDKPTSGVMVIAKNKMSFSYLKDDFAKRRVEKIYLGMVWGKPKKDCGTVQNFIQQNLGNYEKMKVSNNEKGKHAITHYKVLKNCESVSLLKFRLETGRTHQIRVHCRYLDCPLLGDLLYGYKRMNTKNSFISRLMLHSWRLKIYHPRSHELKIFTATPSDEFFSIAESFNIRIKR